MLARLTSLAASLVLVVPISSGQVTVQSLVNAASYSTDLAPGTWTAIFASPSQHSARTYIYSVAEQLPTITRGVKAEGTEAWSGPTTTVMTFQTSDFTVDSDAAYKTAAAKAGDWLKEPRNAAKPVSLSLGAAQRFPAPVWYILMGTSSDGFVSLINASTGNVISK